MQRPLIRVYATYKDLNPELAAELEKAKDRIKELERTFENLWRETPEGLASRKYLEVSSQLEYSHGLRGMSVAIRCNEVVEVTAPTPRIDEGTLNTLLKQPWLSTAEKRKLLSTQYPHLEKELTDAEAS